MVEFAGRIGDESLRPVGRKGHSEEVTFCRRWNRIREWARQDLEGPSRQCRQHTRRPWGGSEVGVFTEEPKARGAGVSLGVNTRRWGQRGWGQDGETMVGNTRGWWAAWRQEDHSVGKLLSRDLFPPRKSHGEGEGCNEKDEFGGCRMNWSESPFTRWPSKSMEDVDPNLLCATLC